MDSTERQPHLEQIAAALAAVKIQGGTAFSWFGQRMPEPPARVRRGMSSTATRHWLRHLLRMQLYGDFYSRGAAAPSADRLQRNTERNAAGFVASLSAANTGKGCWSGQCYVEAERSGGIEAVKDGLRLYYPRNSYRARSGETLLPGGEVEVWNPKELLRSSPGFYLAQGDQGLALDPGDALLRTYWQVSPASAPAFLEAATRELNRSGIPFRLKIASNPSEFYRKDAVVLYLRRSDMGTAWPLLGELIACLPQSLGSGAPAMTKPVAPGVSLAEDPGGGESFGMNRCGLIADALLLCADRNLTGDDEKIAALHDVFGREGLRAETPYLQPGSRDDYPRIPLHRAEPGLRTVKGRPSFLEMASRIGHRLARDAVWWDGRCNWIGASGTVEGNAGGTPVYRNLGPDLYSGVSGLALFLDALFTLTREDSFRHAAKGALHQALAAADSVPPAARAALFSGWVGLAYALARTGWHTNEEQWLDAAKRLIQRLDHEREQEIEEPDVIAGKAGAILGLLALDATKVPGCRDLAVRLGHELAIAAEHSSEGCSWKSVHAPARRNLTGLSHGASGVGFALMELFHVTAEQDFRTLALEAFRYERAHFDPSRRNWPDFRERGGKRSRKGPAGFTVAWCHGAPGIGLARLRACELDPEPEIRLDLEAALSTTASTLRTGLQAGMGSYCLCHGFTGNAELLRLRTLDTASAATPEHCALVQETANSGIDRYGGHRLDFPSGSPGYSPSLMTGLAGVGYFYLSLSSPGVPSILALSSRGMP